MSEKSSASSDSSGSEELVSCPQCGAENASSAASCATCEAKLEPRSEGRRKRPLVRKILKGFTSGVFSRICLALMHIVIGRALGKTLYGNFAYAWGLARLLSVLASIGWPDVITRYVAEYSVQNKPELLRGAVQRGRLIIVIVSLLAVAGWVAAILTFEMFAAERTMYLIATAAVPILALRRFEFRTLLGFHKTELGIFLEQGCVPMLVSLWGLLLPPETPAEAMLAYVCLGFATVVFMRWLVSQQFSEELKNARFQYQTRAWQKVAGRAMLANASNLIMNRIDVLMIGPMLGPAAVGVFSAAVRVTFALRAIPNVCNSIFQPMFASAWHSGRRSRVGKLYLKSLLVSIGLALPIGLVMFFFPELIIKYSFGKDYDDSIAILLIVMFGQLMNCMVGPAGGLLLMTGRERVVGYAGFAVAIGNVVGNLIAIPIWGIHGAAGVTAVCIAANKGWLGLNVWWQLRKQLPERDDDPVEHGNPLASGTA